MSTGLKPASSHVQEDAVTCPRCQKAEIETGACPVCGCKISTAQPATLPFPPVENVVSFPPEKTKRLSDSGANLRIVKEKPIPSWRLEVSQKVQEVLRSRENRAGTLSGSKTVAPPPPAPEADQVLEQKSLLTPAGTWPLSAPAPAMIGTPLAAPASPEPPPTQEPAKSESTVLPVFNGSALDLTRRGTAVGSKVEKSVAPIVAEPPQVLPPPRPQQILLGSEAIELELEYPPVEAPEAAEELPAAGSTRGILLSRTLAGLIDFIVVLFSAVPFFFTLVQLSGYDEVDDFALLVLMAIWLCLYYLYSIFFLVCSGQTIGMMIADLQVVSNGGGLLSHTQALTRVLGFTFSLGLGGLGLGWGLVDTRSRCLHDLLSKTSVVRVSSHSETAATSS